MSDFQFKDNVLSLSKKNEIIIQKCKCTVGRDVELHSHRFIEIAYIASGSGIHDIGDGYSSKIEKIYNERISTLMIEKEKKNSLKYQNEKTKPAKNILF